MAAATAGPEPAPRPWQVPAPGLAAPGLQPRRTANGRRIGILGGSFNPAHEGHRYISLLALKRLQLDQVWWMISPQNPLKACAEIAPFKQRHRTAEGVAAHPRLRVTDIERTLGTVHTVDTMAVLLRRFPDVRFVWMIGADNLAQISQWKQWQKLFRSVPIAVFPRPGYSFRALASKAARSFAQARLPQSRARALAETAPPAWVFLHIRPHQASATRIRAQHGSGGGEATGKTADAGTEEPDAGTSEADTELNQ